MQILAVAGRRGAGKTTLINEIARLVVDGNYGLPRVLTFEVTPDATVGDGLEHVQAELEKAVWDDAVMLENGHPRGELVVLVDDVCYLEEVVMLRRWQATLLFLDADRRLKDVSETWRTVGPNQLSEDYTNGEYPETLFDWHVTNYHELVQFKVEIALMKDYWIGGMIEA